MSDDIIDFFLGGIANFIGKLLGTIASIIGKLLLYILRGIWHGLGHLWNLFMSLFHIKNR